MKNKRKISPRILSAFIVLLMVITLGSYVLTNRILAGDIAAGTLQGAAKYSRHYAFIHAGGDDDLWNGIYEGAYGHGLETDSFVEYFGRELTVKYDSDELLEMAIDAAVDGIIIGGDENDERMSELISRAKGAGIPSVTVFTDCTGSERVCYVGCSNYAIGRLYGEEILRHYKGEDMLVYLVMDSTGTGGGQDLIASGMADEFSDKGLSDVCKIEGIYVNGETAFAAEEDIRDVFLSKKQPNAIVALNSVYTRCLFQAAVDYNRVGELYLYGFNDPTDILTAVAKGLLDATVSVDAPDIGASAVDALDEYIDTGYVTDYKSQDAQLILPGMAAEMIRSEGDGR